MRKTVAVLGMFGLLGLGMGCKHTGGECDCAPVPGDSVGHNPHLSYHAAPLPVATAPGTPATEPTPIPKTTPR